MYTLDLSIKTDLLQKLEDHRVIIRDLKRKLDERTAALAALQAKHDAAVASAPMASLAHELALSAMAASPTAFASAKAEASVATGKKEHAESNKHHTVVPSLSPSSDVPIAARPGMSDDLKRFMVQPLQLLPPHHGGVSAHRRPLLFPAAHAHTNAAAAAAAIEPAHTDSPSSNIRAHTNMSPARETPGTWLLQQRDEMVSLTMRQRAKHHEAAAEAMSGAFGNAEQHSKLGMRSPILVDSSASASTIFSMSGRVGSIDAGALETEAMATARMRMPQKSTVAPVVTKAATVADANDDKSLKSAATAANDKLVSNRMLQLQEKFSQLQTQHTHMPQQPSRATAPTQTRLLRVDISSIDSGNAERLDSVGCLPPARATDDSRVKEPASSSSSASVLNRVRSQPALSANAQEMKFAASVRAALQPVLRRRWNE